MKNKSIYKSIFLGFLFLGIFTVIASGILVTDLVRSSNLESIQQQLLVEAKLVDELIPQYQSYNKLCSLIYDKTGSRITLIQASGNVLCDSHSEKENMNNHSGRREIVEAREKKWGTSVRHSATLKEETMYTAIYSQSFDGFVRCSRSLKNIQMSLQNINSKIFWLLLYTLLASTLLAWLISYRLSRPLQKLAAGAMSFAQGKLSNPLPQSSWIEINHLTNAMNQMASELTTKIHNIEDERNQIRALLSSMEEGVVALDPGNRILFANKSGKKLFKIPQENMVGRLFFSLVHNSDLLSQIQTVREKNISSSIDTDWYTPEKRILSSKCAPLLNFNGSNIGVLLVVQDVTRLRQLDTMRRDFVANVSHELRTPITAIQGYVETLLSGFVEIPSKGIDFLGIIEKNTHRLNAIIKDLLELSKLEENGQELEQSSFEIDKCLLRAWENCKKSAHQKEISFTYDISNINSISGSSNLIEQALQNLLGNAVKYCPAQTQVSFKSSTVGNEIKLSVSDNGNGIAQEHLNRIFERFYRVDKARSREVGGTGLGLAIVKHIALVHGGRVEATSRLGEGSEFVIYLPKSNKLQ